MGDKSQLVCMTLAFRHRALPVLVGAISAFAVLNLLAVLFGTAVAAWLPDAAVSGVVAVLFAIFGMRTLRDSNDETGASFSNQNGRSILLTTWMLIFMAEFGDKTQLAVAGLAGAHSALPVWLGATAGLAFTTSLGVLAGRTLLRRLPMTLLQRLSGAFFLMLVAVAGWHFLRNF